MGREASEQQKQRMKELSHELRKIAEPVGPLHSHWDLIFDLEALADNKETLLDMTPEWFIEYAERLLGFGSEIARGSHRAGG